MEGKFNPTPWIFFVLFIGYFTNIAIGLSLGNQHLGALAVIGCLQIIFVIALFTPLHEAVHRVASRSRFLNDLILQLTWPIFLNSPTIFKKIHLAHHAKTNQGELDPDHYTSADTWTGRWIRSFLLMFNYYHYSFKHFAHSWSGKFLVAGSLGVLGVVLVTLLSSAFAPVFLICWILPAYVGIGILAFLNTAWPHHPGKSSGKYQNTKILLVPKALEWLLMDQNYHLIHHLRPTIPWYRYKTYWKEHQADLISHGAEVLDYRLRPQKGLSDLEKTRA